MTRFRYAPDSGRSAVGRREGVVTREGGGEWEDVDEEVGVVKGKVVEIVVVKIPGR